MTSFDAVAAGTSEADWAECVWLRDSPQLQLTAGRDLVVLAAHPDDETLGAGGLISAAAQAGLDVHVIVASDGAASHPRSPTHSASELARLRAEEATSAVRVLAPQAFAELLSLPDGKLADHRPYLEGALRAACSDGAVLLTPWAYDRHPDHEACARAARRVSAGREDVELLEFPIWAWHWGDSRAGLSTLDPQVVDTRVLTLEEPMRGRKQRAIAKYASQIRPLSDQPGDEAVLSPETLRYFARDRECYFVVDAART